MIAPPRRAGRRLPGDPGRPLTASVPAGAVGRVLFSTLLVAWFALPLLPLAMWAFADRWSYPAIAPTSFGLEGVRTALASGGLSAFGSSLTLGLVVAVIATAIGALAARALVAGWAPFPKTLTVLLFAPIAIPPFALVMGTNVLLLRAHAPAFLGVVLVLVAVAVPYTTFVLRTAYAAHDIGFEEAARALGASRRQVLLRVHLPLIAPALARAAFLAFLVGWSDYVVTLIVGGGQFVTLPMITASLASGIGNDSVVALLSLIATIPPLILVVLLARTGRRRTT
ncbi:ABC transporter permease [Demequina aurantiaca]|uniref:ABC transporter permease n=1 Tax=Demequina aurantiaca TaxID=676200 RepID=UPI003D33767B